MVKAAVRSLACLPLFWAHLWAQGLDSHGENAQGAPIHVEFTAKYDGQDNPVTGSPDFNSIALKRINADTIEATIKKDGMVIGTSRTVISHDGQTRTLTSKGKNAAGQDVNNVVVYDKQ